jgi:hypothetical protein
MINIALILLLSSCYTTLIHAMDTTTLATMSKNEDVTNDGSEISWLHDDNHNQEDDFDDEIGSRHSSSKSAMIDNNDNNSAHYDPSLFWDDNPTNGPRLFWQALETPGFVKALGSIIRKKMCHFRYLQTPTTHDNDPSFADEYELAKQDGAQRYQRDVKYKARDRQKNNPYSRDIRDEDDSVTHQARVAKILGSGSFHNTAADHKNKRTCHGQKAHARYQNNLPQLAITHPQLTGNNTTQMSHVNKPTQQPVLYVPIPVMCTVIAAHAVQAAQVVSNTVRIAPIWSPEKASLRNVLCLVIGGSNNTQEVTRNILGMGRTGVDHDRITRISGHFIENGKVSK